MSSKQRIFDEDVSSYNLLNYSTVYHRLFGKCYWRLWGIVFAYCCSVYFTIFNDKVRALIGFSLFSLISLLAMRFMALELYRDHLPINESVMRCAGVILIGLPVFFTSFALHL